MSRPAVTFELTEEQRAALAHWDHGPEPEPLVMPDNAISGNTRLHRVLACWIALQMTRRSVSIIASWRDFDNIARHVVSWLNHYGVMSALVHRQRISVPNWSCFRVPFRSWEYPQRCDIKLALYSSHSNRANQDNIVVRISKPTELEAWRASVPALIDAHLIPDLARLVGEYAGTA